eukprot:gnl/TRDRNA2_/TRDRNA2_159470_c0_seq2.p1 gnl/TRDRNA2_/TRDRNA2_159470_c0~~gnl/TRDRNA2_/TRDRNA2_159470_c0_seq2.p1  ORF type:complete len:465 (+),score=50.99 gnl/TRDRNA2_/TRDRNA2_159470_c0_seq2:135-1397(+)
MATAPPMGSISTTSGSIATVLGTPVSSPPMSPPMVGRMPSAGTAAVGTVRSARPRSPQQVAGLAAPAPHIRGTVRGAVAVPPPPATSPAAQTHSAAVSARGRSTSPPGHESQMPIVAMGGHIRSESPEGPNVHWCDSNNGSPLPTARRMTSPSPPPQQTGHLRGHPMHGNVSMVNSGMAPLGAAAPKAAAPKGPVPVPVQAASPPVARGQVLGRPSPVSQARLHSVGAPQAAGGGPHQAEPQSRGPSVRTNDVETVSMYSTPVHNSEHGLNVTIASTDGAAVEGELFIYRPPQWSDLSRAMIYVESGEELIHLQPLWMVLRPANGPLLWVNMRQSIRCNGQDILSIKWAAPSAVQGQGPLKSIRLTLMEGLGEQNWDELGQNEALVRLTDGPQGRATLDPNCGQTLRVWLWHAQKAGVAI